MTDPLPGHLLHVRAPINIRWRPPPGRGLWRRTHEYHHSFQAANAYRRHSDMRQYVPWQGKQQSFRTPSSASVTSDRCKVFSVGLVREHPLICSSAQVGTSTIRALSRYHHVIPSIFFHNYTFTDTTPLILLQCFYRYSVHILNPV